MNRASPKWEKQTNKPTIFVIPHYTANAQPWPKSHVIGQCIRNSKLCAFWAFITGPFDL